MKVDSKELISISGLDKNISKHINSLDTQKLVIFSGLNEELSLQYKTSKWI